MNPKSTTPKQASGRVTAKPATPFGDIPDELMNDPMMDRWWIPGWSDLIMENARRRKRGLPEKPLPFRLQFVSIDRGDGRYYSKNVADFASKGYRRVRWDEQENVNGSGYAIDLENSACIQTPEGYAQCASQILMVAPPELAARNWKLHRDRVEAQLQGAERRAKEAALQIERETGLHIDITAEQESVEDE